jgi:hypothetical protein
MNIFWQDKPSQIRVNIYLKSKNQTAYFCVCEWLQNSGLPVLNSEFLLLNWTCISKAKPQKAGLSVAVQNKNKNVLFHALALPKILNPFTFCFSVE